MKRLFQKAMVCVMSMALVVTSMLAGGSELAMAKTRITKMSVTNVDKKAYTMYKGQKFKLKVDVKVTPNKSKYKKVKYSSLNKSVVTVSNKGVMTAKSVGSTKVKVTSKTDSKKSVTLKITVAKKKIKVSSLKLNKTSFTYTYEDESGDDDGDLTDDSSDDTDDSDSDDDSDDSDTTDTEEDDTPVLKLKTTIAPKNALDQRIAWTTTDEDVADVDENGNVFVYEAGTCYIKAKAQDGSGKYAKCKIIVKDNTSDDSDDESDEEEE